MNNTLIKIRRAHFGNSYSQLQNYQLELLRKYAPGQISFYQDLLNKNPELELTLDLNELNNK